MAGAARRRAEAAAARRAGRARASGRRTSWRGCGASAAAPIARAPARASAGSRPRCRTRQRHRASCASPANAASSGRCCWRQPAAGTAWRRPTTRRCWPLRTSWHGDLFRWLDRHTRRTTAPAVGRAARSTWARPSAPACGRPGARPGRCCADPASAAGSNCARPERNAGSTDARRRLPGAGSAATSVECSAVRCAQPNSALTIAVRRTYNLGFASGKSDSSTSGGPGHPLTQGHDQANLSRKGCIPKCSRDILPARHWPASALRRLDRAGLRIACVGRMARGVCLPPARHARSEEPHERRRSPPPNPSHKAKAAAKPAKAHAEVQDPAKPAAPAQPSIRRPRRPHAAPTPRQGRRQSTAARQRQGAAKPAAKAAAPAPRARRRKARPPRPRSRARPKRTSTTSKPTRGRGRARGRRGGQGRKGQAAAHEGQPAKERALMREFGLDETALTEEEVAKRRQELKTLIKLGKTRGFLTHQEINDHLPEKLVEPRSLEAIVSMLNDMGIAVYEQAPDADTLLIAGGTTTTATDEEAEEEAEAALSTVDSEFGRTTDPVRMYMREMGTVELLTREGEIEIAKRIEGGLKAMMQAISRLARPRSPRSCAWPTSIARRRDRRSPRSVDGFVVRRRGRRLRGRGRLRRVRRRRRRRRQGRLQGADQEARGAEGARRWSASTASRSCFEKMRKAYEKEGYGSPAYVKAQTRCQRRADDHPLHGQDDREAVRHAARRRSTKCAATSASCAASSWTSAACRRNTSSRTSRPTLLNLKWVEKEAAAGKPYSVVLARNMPADPGTAAEADRPAGARGGAAGRPEGHQQAHERGREGLARGQEGNDRGQPAPGDLDRQEVHQPRPAVPRPDPGRQHRPDEGGRQVRIPPRLQVLDLRHVVDPPGHHALDRRPGAHHPHPGAHDRDDQQDEPHLAPAPAGVRLRAGRRHAGGEDGDARKTRSARS